MHEAEMMGVTDRGDLASSWRVAPRMGMTGHMLSNGQRQCYKCDKAGRYAQMHISDGYPRVPVARTPIQICGFRLSLMAAGEGKLCRSEGASCRSISVTH